MAWGKVHIAEYSKLTGPAKPQATGAAGVVYSEGVNRMCLDLISQVILSLMASTLMTWGLVVWQVWRS